MEQEKIDEIRAIDKSMNLGIKRLENLRNFKKMAEEGILTIERSENDACYLSEYEDNAWDYIDKLEESVLFKIVKLEKQLKEL